VVRVSDKRERLLGAARDLIYRQGLAQTSLAEIAEESGVPLGNVYYYFKTKEEIAEAVVGLYREEVLVALHRLDEHEADPKRRLLLFIKRLGAHKSDIADHGCPVGSLCQELNKDKRPLSSKADEIIGAEVKWATAQFRLLGRSDAADLAVQLVAALQGISLLGNTLRSPAVIGRQVARLCDWVEGI